MRDTTMMMMMMIMIIIIINHDKDCVVYVSLVRGQDVEPGQEDDFNKMRYAITTDGAFCMCVCVSQSYDLSFPLIRGLYRKS